MVLAKSGPGFSFREFFDRLSFNLLSRTIGFSMRFSLFLIFLFIQLIFLFSLPFIFLILFLFSPIVFLFLTAKESEEEKKIAFKKAFLVTHLLEERNLKEVEAWFENIYQRNKRKQWYLKENLFTIPPLARNWIYGYTPYLERFSQELTSKNYLYTLNRRSIINRQKEITMIENSLLKDNRTNILIVGEEGVGKHTIVDALAKKIYEGKINPLLAYKRILKLNLEKILSLTLDQKLRENLLENLFLEAAAAKNVILLIENFEKYVGSLPNQIDLSIPILKFAKNNNLYFIGLTTPFSYQKFIFPNQSIDLLFEKIFVEEILPVEAKKILLEISPYLEKKYQVFIPYEIIEIIIEKSQYYSTYIPFPEKAIDLLISACLEERKKSAIRAFPQVSLETVDFVIFQKTKIPTSLTEQIRKKLLNLETDLKKRIVGQDNALKELTCAIQRSFILFEKRKKPLASFLFYGPTGVGKTETAKALAEIFLVIKSTFTVLIWLTIRQLKIFLYLLVL